MIRVILILCMLAVSQLPAVDIEGWRYAVYGGRPMYLPDSVGPGKKFEKYQGIMTGGNGTLGPLTGVGTPTTDGSRSQDALDFYHSRGFIVTTAFYASRDTNNTARWAENRENFERVQRSLDEAAADLGHPEISGLHFITHGCSANGTAAQQAGQGIWERCIAIIPHHGDRGYARTARNQTKTVNQPQWQVPCLYVAGGSDLDDRMTLIEDLTYRSNNSVRKSVDGPWSRMVQPRVGHCLPRVRYGSESYNVDVQFRYALEWIDALIAMRVDSENPDAPLVPVDVSQGWLGKYDVVLKGTDPLGAPFFDSARFDNAEIAAYDDVPAAQRGDWIWLPNRETALRWKEHCDTGILAPTHTVVLSGHVGFAQSEIYVSESAGVVQFVMNRHLGRDGDIEVDYRIVSEGARENSDFIMTHGSFTWAHQESHKSFSFEVLDDVLAEGQESFRIELTTSNAMGLRENKVLTVHIIDNDMSAVDGKVVTYVNQDVAIPFQVSDSGNGPYTYTVVEQPTNGVLTESNGSYSYAPNNGFAGNDYIRYRVGSGADDSNNIATIRIKVLDSVHPYVEENGFVVMEAEHYFEVSQEAGNPWTRMSNDATASGRAYITTDDRGQTGAGVNGTSDRVLYHFRLQNSGRYVAWARVFIPDEGGSLSYVEFDDNTAFPRQDFELNGMSGGTLYGAWVWRLVNNGSSFDLSAGDHTLELHRFDDGMAFDKIIITSDLQYAPTDAGPIESMRDGASEPIADAGPDMVIADEDGQSNEVVTLDGSDSVHTGNNPSYSWTEDGVEIATGVNPSVSLADGIHYIYLTVRDNGAIDRDLVVVRVNPASDSELPTQPFNLRQIDAGTDFIALAWDASSDNIEVVEYEIFQNDILVGTSAGLSYVAGGLTEQTSYTFKVRAIDGFGNQSVFSDEYVGVTKYLAEGILHPIQDKSRNGATSTHFQSPMSVGVTNAIGLLKFDISGQENVERAILRIRRLAANNPTDIWLRNVSDDNWQEGDSSFPDEVTNNGTIYNYSITNSSEAGWLEFDVTSFVRKEIKGDGVVTFALRTLSGSFSMHTREDEDFPPQLVVSTPQDPAVVGTIPEVAITTPQNNITVDEGDEVTFAAVATDAEDGTITPEIAWSSNLDGNLGDGGSITVSTLSVGVHTIVATASDSDGSTGSASVQVTVIREVVNTSPEVQITAPGNNTSVDEGVEITFTGTASDDEDGTLTEISLGLQVLMVLWEVVVHLR